MTDIHIIPNEEIQRSYRWRKIWLAYSIIVGLLMTTFLCLWLNEYFNKPSWIVGKGVQLTFDEDTNTYKTSVKAADTSWEDVEVLWPGQAN